MLAAKGFIYAVGVALLAFLISTDAGWQTFVIPFVLCGVGTGGMVAPSMTVAMNDVALAQAGAASGVLNTTRQVATALGAAVVGAVLQNQLLTNMQAGAGSAAAQLPEAVREPFVRGFQAAARRGFQVGRGQSGGEALSGTETFRDSFEAGLDFLVLGAEAHLQGSAAKSARHGS